MPNKSRRLGDLLLPALFFALLLMPAAADTNNTTTSSQQATQLVSKERAMSVLAGTNNSILFVDRQIAFAELEKRDLVSAVANLASARGVFKEASAAFESGDYVKSVELSSDASLQAQRALVAIPATSKKSVRQSAVTFDKASSALKSTNETILFVDMRIAEWERARKDVIKTVELLAEARGLFRQASAALADGDYQSAHELTSDATKKAQDALAMLSEAKPRQVLTPKAIAISGATVILVALVVYFGPLKNKLSKPKYQAQLMQQYPQPVTSGQQSIYYPQTMQAQYQQQSGQSYYNPQQQPPQPTPRALRLTAQAQQQPVPYYNRQQAQPYYAAQPKPLTQPSPAQQQQQPPSSQQYGRSSLWQKYPPPAPSGRGMPARAQPQPVPYSWPAYQKPPPKKQQP